MGWGTVLRAVAEYGQHISDQQWPPAGLTVLGLDETALLALLPFASPSG